MRTLALLIGAVLLLASTACGVIGGGDDKPEVTDEQRAYIAAVGYVGDDTANPPPLGTQYQCQVNVALQPPSPQPTLHPVVANCIWKIEPQGSLWLVTFNETWRCDDFAVSTTKYPACVPPVGFHEWQYTVDLRAGTVTQISSKGQFAPDMRG